MTTRNHPPTLPGCDVLPPMEPGNGSQRRDRDKLGGPKGKPKRRKAGERFAVLNNFADFSLAALTRAEIAVWLLLWRDTKPDGLARTSQADLARRAGIAPRTAKRAIASLVRQGLLAVVFRGSLRRGPSKYRLHPLTTRQAGDTGDTLPPDS